MTRFMITAGLWNNFFRLSIAAVQKNFLYGGQNLYYLPNKSLCVPVRAKVSTKTSFSMR